MLPVETNLGLSKDYRHVAIQSVTLWLPLIRPWPFAYFGHTLTTKEIDTQITHATLRRLWSTMLSPDFAPQCRLVYAQIGLIHERDT